MKNYIEKLTENYSEQNHYMKKKAEYTAILVCMIIVTMLTIMAIEIVIVGYTVPKLLSMIVFVIAFFFLYVFNTGKIVRRGSKLPNNCRFY